jgi:peptidoglycan hydrolase-like protein with peptidoglycan-binding domain
MALSGSVGKGGANLSPDVRHIQQALNIARVQDNLPPIKIDSLVGPKTIGAIQDFQRLHTQFRDGRIDPHGHTLRELEKIVVPVIEARVRTEIVGVLGGLARELQARGLQLEPECQADVDGIERAARGLRAGAVPAPVRPAIYYPQRERRNVQLAFAAAAPVAAGAAVEAALLALLAMIALLIFIQTAPAMGRTLEELMRKIQALMAKLVDEVNDAIAGIEDLVKRNSRAGMRCSAELMLFRQLSQQLLDLLKAPRSADELGRKRFEKQLGELFRKWQDAMEALLQCLTANGAT